MENIQKRKKNAPNYPEVAIFYVSLHSMKKIIFIFALFLCGVAAAVGQARIILPDSSQITTNPDSLDLLPRHINVQERHGHGHEHEHEHEHGHEHEPLDTINLHLPAAKVWLLDTRIGDKQVMPMDTLKYNFQQNSLPDGYSVANGFLAPLGSPYISKVFFEIPERVPFVFYDAYRPYQKTPETQLFYNTRVPFAQLDYQRAGSRRQMEERFKALLTSNFGKKINFGLQADLINALGFYNSQANKHTDWVLFGNYLSDRFETHFFASTSNIKQFENGGITDESYVRNPELLGNNFTSSDIPVRFTNTWNKLGTSHIFVSAKYNMGYYDTSNTSSKQNTETPFVSVASIVVTSHYTGQNRRFLSYDTAAVTVNSETMQKIDQFYTNRYYTHAVDDSTTFRSFKNTVALKLNEGFRPWVKFGLTAFLQHDLRYYSMIDIPQNGNRRKYREMATMIGGVLNKQQGKNLRFNIQADLGVLGANLGELKVLGNVETAFDIAGKQTRLSADAYIKNLTPNFLEENYQSKYFWWNKKLGDTRRVYLGGKLFIPFTNTTLGLAVENVQNHIYFDADKNIAQHRENVQVMAARIDQNIRLGIFNWNNQLVYQTSSNQTVIPVPALSLYSNMFLQAKIANELTIQLGVDAHYHTRYYAPGYEPALLQFYNQREKEIGNYPIATVYANMHLKQTRFFVMYYNAASSFWKPREYYSLPNYPVNPSMIKIGLSVDLHN